MKNFKQRILITTLLLTSSVMVAIAQPRWQIESDGSTVWNIDARFPHYDHIEMSGKQVSVVLRYGVNADGAFTMNKSMLWPMLRTIPNNTHASLMRRFNWNP